MTKILVVSDSHRMTGALWNIISAHPDVNCIFHLGDVLEDTTEVEKWTHIPFVTVAGNCDGYTQEMTERVFDSDGVNLLMTHGHRYQVKYRLDALAYRAQEVGAQAALFGHTHRQTVMDAGGILLINPGAALEGKYALLTLENGEVHAELKQI